MQTTTSPVRLIVMLAPTSTVPPAPPETDPTLSTLLHPGQTRGPIRTA